MNTDLKKLRPTASTFSNRLWWRYAFNLYLFEMNKKLTTKNNMILNPSQNDVIKFNVFFRTSLAVLMLLSAIVTFFYPNGFMWSLLFICFVLLLLLRIVVGIRSVVTKTKPDHSGKTSFFKGIPEDKRKNFFLYTFVTVPIVFLVVLSGVLFIAHTIAKDQGGSLTLDAVLFICLPALFVTGFSIWNYYRILRSGKSPFDEKTLRIQDEKGRLKRNNV